MGINPSLYQGSMETMELPRHYQTILVPSSSFQLVIEPPAAKAAMDNFFQHLLPGGWLLMPFMLLWDRSQPLEWDWHQNGEKIRPGDGATVRRWSYSRFDPDTQLEHTQDRYEVIKDGTVIGTEHHSRSPATREYSQPQALELYHAAGFVEVHAFQGFTHQPAAAEDQIFTLAGKKPG
jgi:hypothetical protein